MESPACVPLPIDCCAAAEHLEAVRPLPVEIDTRSPVRFEVSSFVGNKPVKGAVLQVGARGPCAQLLDVCNRVGRLSPAAKTSAQARDTACVLMVRSV